MILRPRKRKFNKNEPLYFSAVIMRPVMEDAKPQDRCGIKNYVKDIYNLYKLDESKSMVHDDYMTRQTEINDELRAILVVWLIKLHNGFQTSSRESLYLAINIIDRFLSKQTVRIEKLKLVGITAMVIACKFYEQMFPCDITFRKASGIDNISMEKTLSQEQINFMEREMLEKLEWSLSVPTTYVFIEGCLRACTDVDSKMRSLVFLLSELYMAAYAAIKYLPSMLAASAVLVARQMLNKRWSSALEVHSGYKKRQLRECAELITRLHQEYSARYDAAKTQPAKSQKHI